MHFHTKKFTCPFKLNSIIVFVTYLLQAALLGESLKDSRAFGWATPEEKASHDWTKMVTSIQEHIGSLNWGYKVQLREKKVLVSMLFVKVSLLVNIELTN
jgi:hypothetical protein